MSKKMDETPEHRNAENNLDETRTWREKCMQLLAEFQVNSLENFRTGLMNMKKICGM